MTKSTRAAVDQVFRALSDETRLRILCLLLDGELCVGDLIEILRVPQPTVSRHLAYLRRTGLVVTRKVGLWTFYALGLKQVGFQGHLRACLANCADQIPKSGVDAQAARRLRKSGGCCPKTPGNRR